MIEGREGILVNISILPLVHLKLGTSKEVEENKHFRKMSLPVLPFFTLSLLGYLVLSGSCVLWGRYH